MNPFYRHREVARLEHLFFDLDGTLTDSREGIVRSIQHALTTLGHPSPDVGDLRRFVGPPLVEAFQVLLATRDEKLLAAAIASYRDRFGRVGMLENRVYPSIPPALRALQGAGKTLYVVTSKPAVFARRIIEHFGLDRYFASVHGPDLDDPSPDKESLIGRALKLEGLDPLSVVMIGDREQDIRGARRQGIASVAVAWGYGSLQELEAAGPDRIVSSVTELLAFLLPYAAKPTHRLGSRPV